MGEAKRREQSGAGGRRGPAFHPQAPPLGTFKIET